MELLIANAIIAVLAALAIPQYQDFVGRAQVADAVVLLTASRVDVEEHILERGYFPGNETFSGLSTARSGLYTRTLDVTVSDTCSTAGQIQATMRPTGVSAKIAGRTFLIERDVEGNWRCARGGDSALADSYLPNSCRIDAVPKHEFPICYRFKTGDEMPPGGGDNSVPDEGNFGSGGDGSGDGSGTGTGDGGTDGGGSGSGAGGGSDDSGSSKPKSNNGHGNNYDSVDVSNPGKSKPYDPSGSVDDEAGGGSSNGGGKGKK
jgi:type IV pilus assembly protein PilA